MEKELLANNLSTTAIVLIVVFCVLAAGSFLYGVIRKFSRMSWAGWQIVLLFFASFLLTYLPADGDKTLLFALAAGGFLAVVALVLGLGALVRRAIRNHGKYGMGFNAFDRIFGGISALLDWVVFFAAFGVSALAGGALAEYESFGETVTRVAVSLETVLRSSPMSGLLYACNPLRLLAG